MSILSTVLGDWLGCCTGNGEKISSSQAEAGLAIDSAVALFASISCATSYPVTQYRPRAQDVTPEMEGK